MATTIAGGEAFHRWRLQSPEGPLQPGSATQDARSIKFSKTGRYRVPSTLARRQQFSWRRNHRNLSPRGLRTAVATTISRPPSSRTEVSALEGAVCDNWSIVGSVGPLYGPGRQRSHASAGQPGRPEGEDQLGPTPSHHLGPCRRRTFRRTNQMCSTNSLRLRLRRRHHRLPGIHRRRHSDRRAATLRGSGPVSGPVAGRAGMTRS